MPNPEKNICLVKIIMSILHFANLSFDEKSSDTLHKNEKYLRFCLINIFFFYINLKIPSYLWVFFLSDCGLSTAVANALYRSGNKNLCVLCVIRPALGWSQAVWGRSKVVEIFVLFSA